MSRREAADHLFWAIIAWSAIVLAIVVAAYLLPQDPAVRYVPGQGCFLEVDWGALTPSEKAEVGRRLNICTERHFPDSPVRW